MNDNTAISEKSNISGEVMLEKIIEFTNEYVVRMPKKEKKIWTVFYQYRNCAVYGGAV